MPKDGEIRIDKFLWATRIFKTRTIATEACKKGRVSIAGTHVKPSRPIQTGEIIEVRKPPITYSFKVLALAENRMGAKLVPQYLENVTPPRAIRTDRNDTTQRFCEPCQRRRPPHETRRTGTEKIYRRQFFRHDAGR